MESLSPHSSVFHVDRCNGLISLTLQILVKNVGLFATLYTDTTFDPLKTEFLLNNTLSRRGDVSIRRVLEYMIGFIALIHSIRYHK
jgi:hypothetical protein